MPNIPTPFIGGSDSPSIDRTAKRELQPPFAPGVEAEVDPSVRPAEESAIDADPAAAPPVEPDAVAEQEAVAEPAVEAAQEEVLVAEPVSEAEADLKTVISEISEAEAPEMPDEAGEMRAEEDLDIPDFLLGPDATQTAARSTTDAARSETAEALREKAQELLAGEAGDQIRSLISALEGMATEDAVPRAFAAGYLARDREET